MTLSLARQALFAGFSMGFGMSDRYVVVTTEKKGVFFGVLEEETETSVVLRDLQCCVYWSINVRGFVGLAANGPTETCKITDSAPRAKINGWTSILDASEKAVERWKAKPWK